MAKALDLAPGMTLGPGFAAAFDLAPGMTRDPGFANALLLAPAIFDLVIVGFTLIEPPVGLGSGGGGVAGGGSGGGPRLGMSVFSTLKN